MNAMQYGQIVDGAVTKRRVKALKLYGESFQAYCFLRNNKRTFLSENILALTPVIHNKNLVI